jgi:hypothetical protein
MPDLIISSFFSEFKGPYIKVEAELYRFRRRNIKVTNPFLYATQVFCSIDSRNGLETLKEYSP